MITLTVSREKYVKVEGWYVKPYKGDYFYVWCIENLGYYPKTSAFLDSVSVSFKTEEDAGVFTIKWL